MDFSEQFQWFIFEANYTQSQYTDRTSNNWEIINAFKYSADSATHFLNYALKFASVTTDYQSGNEADSLSETYPEKDAYTQSIEYSGFTRLGDSRFYLSWKALIGSSINIESYREQKAELKLVYVF